MDEETEQTPLTSQRKTADVISSAASTLLTLASALVVIGFSLALINFNKWLMRPQRFPHALPLVLIHMIITSLVAAFLRMVKPSLFPALTDPDQRVELDIKLIMKGCLPVALVFAVSLVLSNAVYAHLGVAFIQMIKESNLVWVYIMSVICALEQLAWANTAIVCGCIVGLSLTVKGELHLEAVGFVMQLIAILCESIRIVIQSILLKDKKLDPLSYILLTAPFSGVLVFIAILICSAIPHLTTDLALPQWSDVWHWAPWLVVSALVAFCLNLSIAMFIKRTGPISYVMCQLVKDVCAVVIGARILNETVSPLQNIGFAIEMCFVLIWSLLKSRPDIFKNGIISTLRGDCWKDRQYEGKALEAGIKVTKG